MHSRKAGLIHGAVAADHHGSQFPRLGDILGSRQGVMRLFDLDLARLALCTHWLPAVESDADFNASVLLLAPPEPQQCKCNAVCMGLIWSVLQAALQAGLKGRFMNPRSIAIVWFGVDLATIGVQGGKHSTPPPMTAASHTSHAC